MGVSWVISKKEEFHIWFIFR